LLEDEVRYVILDAYTAGSNKHIFKHERIRVGKILKVPRTYGFVLSGDLVNVVEEFRDYIKVHEKKILEILKNNTVPIEVCQNQLHWTLYKFVRRFKVQNREML